MNDNLIPTSEEVNTSLVNETVNSLAQQIVEEQDIDHTKDLVKLFNWNLSKKNALRLLKLNGLYDDITNQMIERFQKRAGEFSNDDLLKYLSTIESSMEKAKTGLSQADELTPSIQVQNNTQVNFNVLDSFDSDSKERIADAIKGILRSAETQEIKYSDEIISSDITDEEK